MKTLMDKIQVKNVKYRFYMIADMLNNKKLN